MCQTNEPNKNGCHVFPEMNMEVMDLRRRSGGPSCLARFSVSRWGGFTWQLFPRIPQAHDPAVSRALRPNPSPAEEALHKVMFNQQTRGSVAMTHRLPILVHQNTWSNSCPGFRANLLHVSGIVEGYSNELLLIGLTGQQWKHWKVERFTKTYHDWLLFKGQITHIFRASTESQDK